MTTDTKDLLKQFGIEPIKHHFIIEPFLGVGPIRFGMHKQVVSHAFTYHFTSFFKTFGDKVRSDACEVVGLIIHYDDYSHVNYIEIGPPLYGTVSLELYGRDITGISIKDAFSFLCSQSAVYNKGETGYEFPELGIRTYNSYTETEDDIVECFFISGRTGKTD